MQTLPLLVATLILGGPTTHLLAQEGDLPDSDVQERLERLERKNAEMRAQIEALSTGLESVEFRDIIPPVGDSVFGMGPAASKVYAKENGLSIGGYGEMIYTAYAGDTVDSADFLRNILYVGYKFDEKWVFNSEIEVEHADEIFLEFAYLEYLADEAFNVRAGMLLVPMGHVNEMHEPTTFRGPSRPVVESRIIPSTWRENGAGVIGDLGPLSYKLYVVNGLEGQGFDAAGLRDGRQKGSKALADDLAVVARVDWSSDFGLDLGVSGYQGDSGQGAADLGDMGTTVLDVHAQYEVAGLRLRGLYAAAEVDDTLSLFDATGGAPNGTVVGQEMEGWYLEAGYDVASAIAPECGHQVIPYARYSQVDTQAEIDPAILAAGGLADPAQDETITTIGIDWLPIPNIVFKAAYLDFDQAKDRLQLSLGYVF